MRTIRYQEIAQTLRQRVQTEGPGHVLPSESDLSAEFGVSRVTVRRALETLRDEGLVESRQGFGWFVATAPLQQRLGRLDTIEAQLEERGVAPERQILEFAFVPAPAHVRARARLRAGAAGEAAQPGRRRPVRRGHGVVPGRARPAPQPPRRRAQAVLRAARRRSCAARRRPSAPRPRPTADAALLQVPVGSPVLRCERITTTVGGRPVLLSEHIFPAHRTEFVVDLPQAEPSIVPSGLRLVE